MHNDEPTDKPTQSEIGGDDAQAADAETSAGAPEDNAPTLAARSADCHEQNGNGLSRLPHLTRGGLFVLLGLLFIVTLTVVRDILLPFVLAIVIAYVFNPLVEWIHKKRIKNRNIPRFIAVIIIYIVLFSSIYAFAVIVLPRIYSEFAKLAEEAPTVVRKTTQVWIPQLNTKLKDFMGDLTAPMAEYEKSDETGLVPIVEEPEDFEVEQLEPEAVPDDASIAKSQGGIPRPDAIISPTLPEFPKPITAEEQAQAMLDLLGESTLMVEESGEGRYKIRLISDQEASQPPPAGNGLAIDLSRYAEELISSGEKIVTNAVTLTQQVVARIVGSLMTLVLTFMIAAFIMIDTPRIMGFFRSLVPPKYRKEYDQILVGIDRGLGGVIRGQLMICLVNGTLTGVGLFILGVKYALILAMIAAVFSLVPIFGTIISSIPSVGIALTQSFTLGLLVLLWITIIHLIEANILNPKIIGDSAHIHPVFVVLALLAGEHMYGLFGALLAVPVFSIFQTIFLYFRSRAYPEVDLSASVSEE